MDRDGFISNGELFLVLKMMVGNNLKEQQLQQIVDKSKSFCATFSPSVSFAGCSSHDRSRRVLLT